MLKQFWDWFSQAFHHQRCVAEFAFRHHEFYAHDRLQNHRFGFFGGSAQTVVARDSFAKIELRRSNHACFNQKSSLGSRV